MAIPAQTGMKGITAQNDPSANGANKNIRIIPVYIGCRTIAYGPVSITFCPSNISMVRPAKEFSLKERNIKKYPAKNKRLEIIMSHTGTTDQPNRKSNPGIKNPKKEIILPSFIIVFWVSYFSLNFIRRPNNFGDFLRK